MANKHLHLNLKGEYFHAIRTGKKVEEYRLYNDYWRKRMEGREYTRLIIKWGYPSDDEKDRIIVLPYVTMMISLFVARLRSGFSLMAATHEHRTACQNEG